MQGRLAELATKEQTSSYEKHLWLADFISKECRPSAMAALQKAVRQGSPAAGEARQILEFLESH